MFDQLVAAIKKNDLKSFKSILKDKSDKKKLVVFKSTDERHGRTLVHWMACYNADAIFSWLNDYLDTLPLSEKEQKLIFYQQDIYGRNPLHCAARKNHINMVEMLCVFDEGKVLINGKTKQYNLPFNLATDADVKSRLKVSAYPGNHPLRPFLGVHLSTHRDYLSDSLITSSPLKESELYHRSGKHPLVCKLKDKGKIFYKDSKVKLINGAPAHVGSYGHLFQMHGDTFKPTKYIPKHHRSDAKLYDSNLNYKNNLCKQVAKAFDKQQPDPCIQVNHWNNYPSLMIFIPASTRHNAEETKTPSDAAFENWVNFILSCFVGLLNFGAYQIKLPIETKRRGGFGFSTPTVAPTGATFRISMGLLPTAYCDLLVDTLIILDDFLKKLTNNDLTLPAVPKDIFYGSEEHREYLGTKIKTVEIKDSLMLLWAQVEKNGQTTVQNIMRTSYARDNITQIVFNYCYKNRNMEEINVSEAFNRALLWAVKQIEVKPGRSGFETGKLSFKTEEDLSYPVTFKKKSFIWEDPHFWQQIDFICARISTLDDELVKACLKKISELREEKELNGLYYNLDLLTEAFFMHALDIAEKSYGDGYGSDSEEEGVVNEKPIFAKKIVSHSGMRAICAAVIAVSSIKNDLTIYLQSAYYETPLGAKILEKLQALSSVKVVKKIGEANLIIHDINACITNQYNVVIDLRDAPKNCHVILDATSATSSQIHAYLPLFLKRSPSALLVAESGFKNQQLGADKNPHGIIRIFSKTKKDCDSLYEQIKKSEKPVTSPVSHCYRHIMKFFGATLSNKAILSEPLKKLQQ